MLTAHVQGWNCYLSYLNSAPSGEGVDHPTYPPDV